MCCDDDDDDDVELLAECSRSREVSCSSSSIRMAETKGMAVSSSSSEMATTEATGTEVDDDDEEEEKAPDGLCSWTTVARGGGACKTGSCESAASKGLELLLKEGASSNGLWLTRRTAGDAEKDPANMDNSDRVKGRFVR